MLVRLEQEVFRAIINKNAKKSNLVCESRHKYLFYYLSVFWYFLLLLIATEINDL